MYTAVTRSSYDSITSSSCLRMHASLGLKVGDRPCTIIMTSRSMELNREARSLYHLAAKRRLDHNIFTSRWDRYYDTARSRLYDKFSGINPSSSSSSGDYPYGSIFNLEFSPVDDLALTVCANRAIVGYDPRLSTKTKPVRVVPHAHEDCANCITFLDGFTFATCSDDKTIRVWDLRNMSTYLATLQGHSSWVKNIEYDTKSGLLFSIAFVDGVRVWDINNLDEYKDNSNPNNLIIDVPSPIRMRISPDSSKMFLSMRQNICMVVDRFDGTTLQDIGEDVQKLLNSTKGVVEKLKKRTSNCPSVHTMSGLKGPRSFRAVMSSRFHPSSDFIALRHIDAQREAISQELTTLYDLRDCNLDYNPLHTVDECQENYLKYVDDPSPNEALDFIKEISFSNDGRILASPFETGVRLLAVDSSCTPMDVYFDSRYHSKEKALNCPDLEVVQTSFGHHSPVLTCRFSNHDMILGTGCLQGKIVFHKPYV